MRCSICKSPANPDAPLPLCTQHLLEAHDWIVRDTGVTDTLPSACQACGSPIGVKYPSGWICAVCEWKVGSLPEPAEPVRVDVVYYIRWRDRIKIGTSGNPRLRLASLPYEELLAFERGGRMLEQRRHAQFAEYRYPGSEWFTSHPALTAHIRELGAGVDTPWSQYAYWVSRELARQA
jgi:hypothetical protein